MDFLKTQVNWKMKEVKDLRDKELFQISAKGAVMGKAGKKKLPHTLDDLIGMEDHLQRIQQKIRQIRSGMKENGISSIELASGTFVMHLEYAEEFATKFFAEYELELAAVSAQKMRAKKLAEQRNRAK